MPLFVIVGGVFFRSKSFSIKGIRKDIKRLLLPYLSTVSILFIYTAIIVYIDGGGNMRGLGISSIYPNGIKDTSILPIWFLLAIFWSRLIVKTLFQSNINGVLRWGIIITLSWGVYLYQPMDTLPLCLTTGTVFIIFYAIGFQANKIKIYNSTPILLASLLLWGIYLLALNTNFFHLYREFTYPLYVLGATGATVIVYQLALLIEQYLPKFRHVLCWFGKYSMIVLCVHTIDRYIPIIHLLHLDLSVFVLFISRIAVCVIGVFIVKRIRCLRFVFQVK